MLQSQSRYHRLRERLYILVVDEEAACSRDDFISFGDGLSEDAHDSPITVFTCSPCLLRCSQFTERPPATQAVILVESLSLDGNLQKVLRAWREPCI